jgi:magnesium chelatase family protein
MRLFARTTGAAVFGSDAPLVDVQVSVTMEEEGGEPVFRIVGLPDSALREGRERIRGAIVHAGWHWPHRPVTVNLAPASSRKEGAALDLPIALAVLGATRILGEATDLASFLCLGELTLDGSVRPVRGVLAAAEAARAAGLRRALVPRGNAAEAAAVADVEVFAVESLRQAVGHLTGKRLLTAETPRPWRAAPWNGVALEEVRSQDAAVRAATVAAAGGHNLLLAGPPGAGKTLLARCLRDLLPPLTYEEALEVTRIHSVAGLLEGGLVARRPFRAPHHTTSLAGLVGGGGVPRPGEISLAHLGVLFLDELAEFPRASLEALRQPLEDGRLTLGRAAGRASFPSEFLLVGATNPCPCGWRGVDGRCRCTARDIARYGARLSGPLRDRFDVNVDVGAVKAEALLKPGSGSKAVPDEMRTAARMQLERAERQGRARPWNARIPGSALPGAVDLTPGAERALVADAQRLGMTGRGIHRCLRVARTIADLAASERVEPPHVREALHLRVG